MDRSWHWNAWEGQTLPDVVIEDRGALVLVRPLDGKVLEWIRLNVSSEQNWMLGGLLVEVQYLQQLLDYMREDGIVLAVANQWDSCPVSQW